MQCTRSGSSTPMGRDPDSRWVQWLALTRRNNPACLSGAMSPTSSTSSLPMACSHLSDSGRVRSCSSATSYFALLSAAADTLQRQDGRKQHYSGSGSGSGTPTARHLDSSWVAWLKERGQRQDTTPMPCTGHYASEPVQFDSTAMSGSFFHPSAFTTTATTTTPPSMVSSAETPFPSPLAPGPLTDADLDALSQQFPDFPDLPDTFPDCFTDMAETLGPFDPADLDAGLLTWLDEQHAFAFNLGEEPAPVSPSKRDRNPAELSAEGTAWEGGVKKQKVYHGV